MTDEWTSLMTVHEFGMRSVPDKRVRPQSAVHLGIQPSVVITTSQMEFQCRGSGEAGTPGASTTDGQIRYSEGASTTRCRIKLDAHYHIRRIIIIL